MRIQSRMDMHHKAKDGTDKKEGAGGGYVKDRRRQLTDLTVACKYRDDLPGHLYVGQQAVYDWHVADDHDPISSIVRL